MRRQIHDFIIVIFFTPEAEQTTRCKTLQKTWTSAELDTNNQTIKIAQAIPDKANQKKGRNQALANQKKGNNNKNL